MADFTICRNDDCQERHNCYRYNAKPSERQSYAVFDPDIMGCWNFIGMKEAE